MSARSTRSSAWGIGGILALCVTGCGSDAADPVAPDRATERPAVATVSTGPPPQIAAGGGASFVSFAHTCAIVEGHVQCWGADGTGQLGDGFATVRNPLPTRVRDSGGFDGGVTALSAGRSHTCALRKGQVWCWGQNDRRQIGAMRPALFPEPVRIAGLPDDVSAIASGAEFNCAVASGQLWCWGRGTDGELGLPTDEHCGGYRADERCAVAPRRIPELGNGVQAVALGGAHGCAIVDGDVFCWGRNHDGQLGDGGREGRPTPTRVADLKNATAIAAGRAHTCASAETGVFCWGRNDRGQLGDGTRDPQTSPRRISGLGSATHLAAGAVHTCAISDGKLACWGANESGQLGRNGADVLETPVRVEGVAPVIDVAAAMHHTCAVARDGRVLCFGANDYGQLGRGVATNSSAEPTATARWDRGQLRDRNGDGRIVVSCLGDSNTQSGFRVETTWCERLEADIGDADWKTVNRGWSGATAISLPSLRRAEEQLNYTLEFDAPDAVILSTLR